MTLPKSPEVRSLEEALSILFDKSFNRQIGRHRSPFVFRGLPNKEFKLETSLARATGQHAAKLEIPLLRNFLKYAQREPATPRITTWNAISLAQHHALPTRLLDWTWSPLVALHFATADISQKDADGRVWAIDLNDVIDQLPFAIRTAIREEAAWVPTVEMLDRYAPELADLAKLQAEEPAYLMMFEPPCIDARITNQYALFSVMPSATVTVESWLERHSNAWRTVDIPAAAKWEIRDKLDSMNINERLLFPGLDGLATWLRRHYGPGPDARETNAQD